MASMKDIGGEVREFLTTRRAKITRCRPPPCLATGADSGWPGCARDEVALLASM